MNLRTRPAAAWLVQLSLAAIVAACGAGHKRTTATASAVLAGNGGLPTLHRNITWLGAARSITAIEEWLGLSAALRDSPDLARVARMIGIRALDAARLATVGIAADRPVGVVGLDREHGTYAVFVAVSDPARFQQALERSAERDKVALQRSVIGQAKLWVPSHSPRYGVLLRDEHAFLVVTRGATSVRDQALVSLASIDASDTLASDTTYRRTIGDLHEGRDVILYVATNRRNASIPTAVDATSYVLSGIDAIAIGATLDGSVVQLDASLTTRERAKRPPLLVRSTAPLQLFGARTDAVELTAAGHATPNGLLGLLDAWWRGQGAPPVERVYKKLIGRSLAGDWRPLLTGALTIARTASASTAALSGRGGHDVHPNVHMAIGVSDERRTRQLLTDLVKRVPLLSSTTTGTATTFWLRTDQKRRLQLRVADGSLLITNAAKLPPRVSSAQPATAPSVLRRVIYRRGRAAHRRGRAAHPRGGGAVLVAEASFLASLLLPVEQQQARLILPVPAPGAPLSKPYEQLVSEIQRVYGAINAAWKQSAEARRWRHSQMWAALGRVELVAVPAPIGTDSADATDATDGAGRTSATGTLRLRGASQALIHVALTAAATSDARLLRLRNHVSALTVRAKDLRKRARLRRQHDIADYLLRKQLSQPPQPTGSTPPASD